MIQRDLDSVIADHVIGLEQALPWQWQHRRFGLGEPLGATIRGLYELARRVACYDAKAHDLDDAEMTRFFDAVAVAASTELRKSPDTDNLSKQVLDVMQSCGFFAVGDGQVASQRIDTDWHEHDGVQVAIGSIELPQRIKRVNPRLIKRFPRLVFEDCV